MSIISSAALIISSSCSTTSTEFPRSLNSFRTLIRRLVSRGWSPMLGSSRMYIEPTRLLPREVERFILWDSPPDNDAESRSRVRYGSPTSIRNLSRIVTSFRSLSATFASVSLSSIEEIASYSFPTGIETSSWMVFPSTLKYPASFLNRDPLHSGQIVFPR